MEHLEISVKWLLNEYQQDSGAYFLCRLINSRLCGRGIYMTGRYRFDDDCAISTVIAQNCHRLLPEHIRARCPSRSSIEKWFYQDSEIFNDIFGEIRNNNKKLRNLRIIVLKTILEKHPNAVFKIPMTAILKSSWDKCNEIVC